MKFQRNGSAESSIWKTDIDKFQGYVRAKLEDLEEIQKDQWSEHRSIKNRISDLEKRDYYIIGGLVVVNVVIGTFIAAVNAGLISLGGI